MQSCVIIPARHGSTRFAGKPLVPLLGKPMVLWVAELSARAVGAEHVYVATESEHVHQVVESAGFKAIMTSPEALTGTDRIAEAASVLDYDVFINVQGDEPLVDPADIIRCRDEKLRDPGSVINGFTWLGMGEDASDIDLPKVVTNEQDMLVYMSRAAIPGCKNPERTGALRYKKQVCIYAFTRQELHGFAAFGRKGQLEACEDIEILRFFELGCPVRMVETRPGSLAVDRPCDVAGVEDALRRKWRMSGS
ncbi:3-deoxy-manno-octulosonate cytidylyltransferase [Croceicoccus sp. F390]|uniref:3-deoxy-manno-octulosonate cytidylyltransferase n=1 Tax=Croceicoccus esteveae TaxID=3075597 RepID=A0ABU2ZGK8_9SPHN|nr:3-deoxy-manno-octulosonate cytidylyltransferase [Croceicoccus sp. F390]MDT0575727.1 3-deoxy-manno-octulosonate cytidylyltransferase [Croceicoccus sp. F390]